MVSFEEQLLKVENEWSNQLFMYCQQLFENKSITSHDHWHHRRVWNNAKKILSILHYNSYQIDYTIIVQTIIACYFHDTGLTVTIEENHGKAGSLLCSNFFAQQNIPIPDGFNSILTAIKDHEIKDDQPLYFNKEPILTILSVADDIDALGYIGIYRYAEIYLMRGIPIKEIPSKVIKNLDKRFKRLERSMIRFSNYIPVVKKNYHITKNFFLSYQDNSQENESSILLQLIKNEIIENDHKPEEVFQQYLENNTGPAKNHIVSLVLNEMIGLNESMYETGFKPNELIINEKKLSWFSFIFLLFIIIFMFLPFYIYWGNYQTLEGVKTAFTQLILWLIPIVIFHEGLHGLTWALSMRDGIKNVKFGFNKEMLAPFTHCKVPLSKLKYLIGGMSPFILMGLVPAIVCFYLGNAYWFTISLLCIWTSAGDVLSNYHLLRVSNKFRIQDHPKKLGFILVE
jgi:HD superfamily phosphodiesterase